MELRVEQESQPITSRRWQWGVWLEGPDDRLDQIESVTYQLHETFPNPIRTVSDRGSNFKLESSGWGEFMIYVTVNFREGTTEQLLHWLRLGPGAAAKEVLPPAEVEKTLIKIFLASSLADSDVAEAVGEALERQGAKVMTLQDTPAGASLESSLSSMLDEADIGVAVVSGKTSAWVEAEVVEMDRRKKPVIPLFRLLGADPDISAVFQALKGIPVDSDSDLEDVAKEVLEIAPNLIDRG